MTDKSSNLMQRLRQAWRKERRFTHTRGFCYFMVWAIVILLLDLLIDWLFVLPGWARTILLAVNLGIVVYVAYFRWWRYLDRFDAVRIALQVERKHPELQSVLVSYVQFGSGAGSISGSPALIAAVKDHALTATRPIDFREVANYRELKRIALVSACVLIFFGLTNFLASDFVKILLYRLINPTASLAYPTKTHLVSINGNASVKHGESIIIQANVSGLVPEQGTLYCKMGQGAYEKIAINNDGNDAFAHRFKEVYQDFKYYVKIGDCESPRYDVIAVRAPAVQKIQVKIAPPEYVLRKFPGGTVESLNLQAPAGSTLSWALTTDQPVTEARLVRETADARIRGSGPASRPATAIKMTLDASGRNAQCQTLANESFFYRLEWKDKAHGYDYQDPVRYSVTVNPDNPPLVTLLSPATDEKATVKKTMSLVYKAKDDYGLGEASIVYRLNIGPEQRKVLQTLSNEEASGQGKWKLADSFPDLKPGDTVSYRIEVADNCTAGKGPNLGKSATRTVNILTPEEYLLYVLERSTRLSGQIEPIYETEKSASDDMKALGQKTATQNVKDNGP